MRSTIEDTTILVTGATGKVGSETVRRLAAQHAPVRALVRDASRARSLAGAELAVGDFDQPATLAAAMDGVATVVLVSPGGPPSRRWPSSTPPRRPGWLTWSRPPARPTRPLPWPASAGTPP